MKILIIENENALSEDIAAYLNELTISHTSFPPGLHDQKLYQHFRHADTNRRAIVWTSLL